MIPSTYPIVCLIVAIVLLAAIVLAPCLRAFRRCWFILAAALAIIWAGDKPTPPSAAVKIAIVDTTASNVTVNVACATNHVGSVGSWQARRVLNGGVPAVENGSPWTAWTSPSQSYVISSTNETLTVNGRFVSGRKDSQIRLVVDDDPTNAITP